MRSISQRHRRSAGYDGADAVWVRAFPGRNHDPVDPWLREQPFVAGYWVYTFAVSALPLAALRFIERGYAGPVASMALPLFVAANLIIGTILLGTIVLLLKGKLLPAQVVALR